MKGSLSKILTIFWKDVLLEVRTKEIVTSILVFALLVVVIFNFAFEPETATMSLVAPGILWVAFTFAGVLGLNRIFAIERENSRLAGLLLCPVDPMLVYWGKLLGSFSFMLAIEIIVTPIFLVLLNLPLLLPRLVLVIVLATLGFTSVGTLFSALAINIKARDIMLPILFLPIVVPVVIAAVEATALILQGSPWGDMMTWLQIMMAFDIIYLVVTTLVFQYVVEG